MAKLRPLPAHLPVVFSCDLCIAVILAGSGLARARKGRRARRAARVGRWNRMLCWSDWSNWSNLGVGWEVCGDWMEV